ncbi:hypothetical protein E5161_07495 [Cohnella pontilimi]|uniref:Uncharacterized protein n=1 Tax=Cohnella pontilimi TaxID=2564100 RepID=A0A4U0FCR2_9BACL|nr:hypothetical protein [Cohnella pontilimi]TJY42686.1 hypothetical protein E5161_07495 [Cohnella pontilimi]
MNIVKLIFNRYERNTRLFPVLVIISPFYIAAYCLIEELRVLPNITAGLIFLVLALSFLTKVVRKIGKEKEKELIASWEGLPTTRHLRHRDTYFDSYTKARYHDFLSKNVPNLSMPTKEEEMEDPKKADEIYQSAVKWLITQTRDTNKYSLLFHENINYGGVRNFWALRPFAIPFNVLVLLSTSAYIYSRYELRLDNVPPLYWITIIYSIAITTVLIVVTKHVVHTTAMAYARTLLEVCDELNTNKSGGSK